MPGTKAHAGFAAAPRIRLHKNRLHAFLERGHPGFAAGRASASGVPAQPTAASSPSAPAQQPQQPAAARRRVRSAAPPARCGATRRAERRPVDVSDGAYAAPAALALAEAAEAAAATACCCWRCCRHSLGVRMLRTCARGCRPSRPCPCCCPCCCCPCCCCCARRCCCCCCCAVRTAVRTRAQPLRRQRRAFRRHERVRRRRRRRRRRAARPSPVASRASHRAFASGAFRIPRRRSGTIVALPVRGAAGCAPPLAATSVASAPRGAALSRPPPPPPRTRTSCSAACQAPASPRAPHSQTSGWLAAVPHRPRPHRRQGERRRVADVLARAVFMGEERHRAPDQRRCLMRLVDHLRFREQGPHRGGGAAAGVRLRLPARRRPLRQPRRGVGLRLRRGSGGSAVPVAVPALSVHLAVEAVDERQERLRLRPVGAAVALLHCGAPPAVGICEGCDARWYQHGEALPYWSPGELLAYVCTSSCL